VRETKKESQLEVKLGPLLKHLFLFPLAERDRVYTAK